MVGNAILVKLRHELPWIPILGYHFTDTKLCVRYFWPNPAIARISVTDVTTVGEEEFLATLNIGRAVTVLLRDFYCVFLRDWRFRYRGVFEDELS